MQAVLQPHKSNRESSALQIGMATHPSLWLAKSCATQKASPAAGAIIMDKTGTLTMGRPGVSEDPNQSVSFVMRLDDFMIGSESMSA